MTSMLPSEASGMRRDSIAPPGRIKLAKLSCSAVVGEGYHMLDVTELGLSRGE